MDNKKTILVVEDEVPMLEAITNKLKNEGFNVLSAKDGEEGYNIAKEEKPDLLMLDIIMPKLDGMGLLKKIRAEKNWGADVPIIMLSNLSDPEMVSEAAGFGVFDFLVKTDWRLDDVVVLIRQKLNT